MSDEREHPTFEDDPVGYCKSLYYKFSKHNDQQQDRILRNRKFYEGIDDSLEDRKNNASVIRSARFVHELRPAIDSVVAAMTDAILEQNNPVKMLPTQDSTDEPRDIADREVNLNEELRDMGILVGKFIEVLTGGAMMPLVACKIGWEEREGWIYEKKTIPERAWDQIVYFLSRSRYAPSPIKRRWGVTERGPYAEILDYDEFLYDPTVDNLEDSEALIHRKYMTLDEIEEMVKEGDFDESVIERIQTDYSEEQGGASESDGTIADKSSQATEDREVSYKDGKYLVCEFWIPTHDKEGRAETRILTLCALKYKLEKSKHGRRSRWDKMKFPFVVFCFNKQFNRIEGTPLVEVGMEAQKIYNDNINAFLDYLTYGAFPVLVRVAGTEFTEKPVFGPGKIWSVNKPDGLDTLHIPAGDLGSVLQFSEKMEGKMRQLINAPDTSQGIPGVKEEKATKTIQRARGTQTRNRVPAKLAGDFVTEVARIVIFMHQIMNDEEWYLDIKLDVPSLTGAKTPQEERDEAVFLLEQAKTNPVYQTPTGLLKLRNLTEEVYLKFRKRDIDKILPTAEELGIVDPIAPAIEEAAKGNEQADVVDDGMPMGDVIGAGGSQTEE